MFGRDLIEQVRADAKGEERYTPVIVEKCIDAVDALGELVVPFRYASWFKFYHPQPLTMRVFTARPEVLAYPRRSPSCSSGATTTLSIFATRTGSTISAV